MIALAVDNGARPAKSDRRRSLLAKLHIARKALAMQEEDYRHVLERETGKRSAKDCSEAELSAALNCFTRMGFRPAGPSKRRELGGGMAVRKARAMWISLYQLGAIEDGSDAALESFGRRQLRVERLRWASEREMFRLIEALKSIAARHGWPQDVPGKMPTAARVALLLDRLIAAQLAKLEAAGVAARGIVPADRAGWPVKRLERAAGELGFMIRELPASARGPIDAGDGSRPAVEG